MVCFFIGFLFTYTEWFFFMAIVLPNCLLSSGLLCYLIVCFFQGYFCYLIVYFFQGYFVSLFNRFDFFVVLSSLLELILTNQNVMPPLGEIFTSFYAPKLKHVLQIRIRTKISFIFLNKYYGSGSGQTQL